MRIKARLTSICSVILLFGSVYAVAGTWTTLDYPGAGVTYAYGISGNDIVGTYLDAYLSSHGFLYNMTTQSWTTLDYPGTVGGTNAYGISGDNIVGTYTGGSFLYNITTQSWTTLPNYPGTPGTDESFPIMAFAISGNNIVGVYANDTSKSFLYDGTSWTTPTYPGAIVTRAFGISGNNIVGDYQASSQNNGNEQGFLFNGTNWTTIDYPGAIGTRAYDISGNNIVGFYQVSGYTHGFIYDGTNWTTLDYLEASTVPNGINGNNIAGYYFYGDGHVHGFLYNPYSGGTGEPNTPYQIATKVDLLAMAADTADYDKCFILTADIDMQGQVFMMAIIAPDISTNDYFQGTAFTGTFDGNGHKITNFTINGGSNTYLGLFGQISTGGSVKNLGLENCSVSGSEFVGGLVGYKDGGYVSNCYSTGAVSGSEFVGGLVGSGSGLSYCYSTGQVSGSSSSEYIGGLVGENEPSSISNCYSTGAVSGGPNSQYFGGLVGSGNHISNCYSTSSVSVGSGSSYIGGLVGGDYSSISDCYSTGLVSGGPNSQYVGGLVGINYVGSISSSYFLDVAGPDNGYGTPLTDVQMKQQSIFISWDFTNETTNGTNDYWRMCVDGVDYPRLTWEFTRTHFITS